MDRWNGWDGRTFESATVHGYDLYVIAGCLLSIQSGDGGLDDARVRFDLEDDHARVLIDGVLLDRVGEFGVGSFVGIVVVDGGHGHDHHPGRPVLRDVAEVDAVPEERRVVVDVLQVDLDVGEADQSLTAFVLSEHRETPLRTSVGLIPIQRLQSQQIPRVIINSDPVRSLIIFSFHCVGMLPF